MMPKIMLKILFIYQSLVATVTFATTDPPIEIVPRTSWKARPPTEVQNLPRPVPYVVIHHSYVPPACNTTEDCLGAMRWMQDFHQINRSWADIGYNFAVGGDGQVYEGRGWRKVGAHAFRFNGFSVGICLIGDWSDTLPPHHQLTAVQRLIARGVREGHIAEDYALVGHKQVREGTVCPGDRLYAEIQGWPHFDATPTLAKAREWGKAKAGTSEAPPPVVDNKIRKRTASFLNRLM